MKTFTSIPWRRLGVYLACALALCALYWRWTPGVVRTDGAHDLGRNAIWLQHGWIGDDLWFETYGKEAKKPGLRGREPLERLTARLRAHGITDLYPHLAPCDAQGRLLEPDHDQLALMLDVLSEERVMPWIGGVDQLHVKTEDAEWRRVFVREVGALLARHPRLAGVHLNIEPWPSGSLTHLALLDELRAAMPDGAILSVAASPPPVPVVGNLKVHWSTDYITRVAGRADQLAFMNYDTSLRSEKLYVALQDHWVEHILEATGDTPTLIGLPTYDDAWAPWHDPDVENLTTSLAGLHSALGRHTRLPPNYQGIALYSDWETSESEWDELSTKFNR